MGGCESGQRKATLDQTRNGGVWRDIELDVLRTDRVAGDTDICKTRFSTDRKWRRRALREKPLVGRKSLFRPVPAPCLDSMGIGPERLGQMVTHARRDK